MAPDAAILTATLKGTCFLLNYQHFLSSDFGSLTWDWSVSLSKSENLSYVICFVALNQKQAQRPVRQSS